MGCELRYKIFTDFITLFFFSDSTGTRRIPPGLLGSPLDVKHYLPQVTSSALFWLDSETTTMQPVCGRSWLQLVKFGKNYFPPSRSKIKSYMLYSIGHATLTYYNVEHSLAGRKKNQKRPILIYFFCNENRFHFCRYVPKSLTGWSRRGTCEKTAILWTFYTSRYTTWPVLVCNYWRLSRK